MQIKCNKLITQSYKTGKIVRARFKQHKYAAFFLFFGILFGGPQTRAAVFSRQWTPPKIEKLVPHDLKTWLMDCTIVSERGMCHIPNNKRHVLFCFGCIYVHDFLALLFGLVAMFPFPPCWQIPL